ncbi:alpha/beta fold hydrolase [Amycolatopsis viridis]|uniref:Alpha-beta hydrolase superfamily lysophospholipase n=1 Tax=Amycolatopsis viridis TaxID=185678 RepID=A0ABX0SVG3_9PSEU|nr:alpha/beta fold hydrolase [Amycolatopsis viridis]NIH80957.1 alpha-beta hydrolase superfamily lysophospholipase [Amycolatopsis viridis]
MAEFAGRRGTIHHRQWIPDDPQALVVFFHGLGEHVGSYEPLATALTGAGFALWAHDHAGHGRSDGERVLITRIDDLLDDAATLLGLARQAHPDLPLVVAGHSLGATVATLLTAERLLPAGIRPAALVLAGSSIVPVPGAGGGLAGLLASGVDPLDLRKDPGELTRHPGYAQQIREDPLTWQGGIRVETLAALGAATDRLAAVVPTVDVPVLLLHGEQDDLAPAEGARRAAELLADAEAVIFPDDLHNILNELDRDEVHATFVAFVRSHLQGER